MGARAAAHLRPNRARRARQLESEQRDGGRDEGIRSDSGPHRRAGGPRPGARLRRRAGGAPPADSPPPAASGAPQARAQSIAASAGTTAAAAAAAAPPRRNLSDVSSFLSAKKVDPDGYPRVSLMRAKGLAEIVGRDAFFVELHAQFCVILAGLVREFGLR